MESASGKSPWKEPPAAQEIFELMRYESRREMEMERRREHELRRRMAEPGETDDLLDGIKANQS